MRIHTIIIRTAAPHPPQEHRAASQPWCAALFALLATSMPAAAGLVVVDGRSNIFAAGYDTTMMMTGQMPGLAPTASVAVVGGSTIRVGTVEVFAARPATPGHALMPSPDGFAGGPDSSIGGINIIDSQTSNSGVRAERNSFLAGVFLGPGHPAGTAPTALDFRAAALGIEFESVSPTIGQVFFIGDGRAESGMMHRFLAPLGATRLVLGSADALNASTPSGYDDNWWNFRADVISDYGTTELRFKFGFDEPPPAIPGPGALALLCLAAVSASGGRRRRA